MSLFFWLFTFAINLWHRKFVTADVTAVFDNNQHGRLFSDEDKILIKCSCLEGYTAKRLTDEFPEKCWTKCVVNKLLKTLRDTGIVYTRQKFEFFISLGNVATRLR